MQGTQDGSGTFKCNLCYCNGQNVYYRSRMRYVEHLKRHPRGIIYITCKSDSPGYTCTGLIYIFQVIIVILTGLFQTFFIKNRRILSLN